MVKFPRSLMPNPATAALAPSNGGETRTLAGRFRARGEMADRIRAGRWEETSLGPVEGWPEPLIWSLNLMLESQFPTAILWGRELLEFYNDAYIGLIGEKHPSLLGRPAAESWAEAWHIVGPEFASVLERGESIYREETLVPVMRHGQLEDVYWTYSYSPIRGEEGAVAGVLVVSHDVTAKRAAERERDAVAANLRSVLDSITDGLAVLDKDWRYTYFNEQGARMLGYRAEDLVGKPMGGILAGAQESVFGREYRRAVETGRPAHFEGFYGEPLNAWLECHCYPSKSGLSVYFRDVTERKRTEQALRASESRFRKLFESNLMGICIPDRFGAFRESNDELLRMTGYTRADLEAGLVRWDTMTPPEYAALDAAHIEEAAARGSCTPYEKEYIRKDGSRVPILCGYALLEESHDEYIGFVMDLSPVKQVEAELREREERFHGLTETLPQLIWMSDSRGKTTYCNQRVADYFGVAASDLPNVSWRPRLHPDDVEPVFAAWWRSIETQEPYQVEYRLRRHDGCYRHFLVRSYPLRNEAGEVDRWIGSSTDIHDQKLAEEALRRTEKLSTAGRLAASIAHEINNPLAAVTNTLYLALRDPALSEGTREYLKLAEQELARVAHITTQTLRFYRQSKAAAVVDLGEVMDSVLAMFRPRLAGKQIAIEQEWEADAVVECFADELRQVFANFISNAMDATPPGGKLRLRIRKSRSRAAKGVTVTVADTGHGIPEEVKGRLFEPFVSTKEATGIGLGLWVSDGIVRKHKGRIRIRSRAEGDVRGTVIQLFLPASGVEGTRR